MVDTPSDNTYMLVPSDANSYILLDDNVTYVMFENTLPEDWEANQQGAIIGGSNVKGASGGSGGTN